MAFRISQRYRIDGWFWREESLTLGHANRRSQLSVAGYPHAVASVYNGFLPSPHVPPGHPDRTNPNCALDCVLDFASYQHFIRESCLNDRILRRPEVFHSIRKCGVAPGPIPLLSAVGADLWLRLAGWSPEGKEYLNQATGFPSHPRTPYNRVSWQCCQSIASINCFALLPTSGLSFSSEV